VLQQSLDRPYIRATLEQMGGKAVAKRMRTHSFGQPNLPSSDADGFVDHAGIHMMAPDDPGAGFLGKMAGRQNILSTPLAACLRIFSRQGMWEIDFTMSLRQVGLMQCFHLCEVVFQQGNHRGR
jgi:hypothetical protein